jgi:K+-sensing histidine kinase KdpD
MLPAAKPPTALLLACLSLIAVPACTWVAFSLQFNFASVGFLYLVLIVVTALYGGFWVATLNSVVAIACLNYFFTPPVFSFTVTHPENWGRTGRLRIHRADH